MDPIWARFELIRVGQGFLQIEFDRTRICKLDVRILAKIGDILAKKGEKLAKKQKKKVGKNDYFWSFLIKKTIFVSKFGHSDSSVRIV